MKPAAWRSALARGVAEGFLPPEAGSDTAAPVERPWPVIVLTFLGAQLAAIPLMLFAGLLMGDILWDGSGPYFCGPLLMAGALVVLRARNAVLFIEHLALVALTVGIGLLAFALFRDLGMAPGAVLSAALCIGSALLIPIGWVRSILGASAVGLLLVGALDHYDSLLFRRLWLVCLLMALAWIAGLCVQHRCATRARPDAAIMLEHVLGGWLMAVVAVLALSSGASMLFGAAAGSSITGNAAGIVRHELLGRDATWRDVQALLAAAIPLFAWFWARRKWRVMREPLAVLLALALALLAWFMPSLGPLVAIALVCLLTLRPVQASAAVVGAAWVIGSFYYTLSWGLIEKSQLLVGVGLALALCAWLTRSRQPSATAGAPASLTNVAARGRWRTAGIAVGLAATLLVVNVAIRDKEDLLAHGRKVYVELVPVDPRSLMQGDYMALNYHLSPALQTELAGLPQHAKPLAQGRIDARGVVQLDRLADGTPQASDGMRIALLNKGGRWLIASDAWFFREGDGQRWSQARYAEFRVNADGRALLAGMARADLTPILP